MGWESPAGRSIAVCQILTAAGRRTDQRHLSCSICRFFRPSEVSFFLLPYFQAQLSASLMMRDLNLIFLPSPIGERRRLVSISKYNEINETRSLDHI